MVVFQAKMRLFSKKFLIMLSILTHTCCASGPGTSRTSAGDEVVDSSSDASMKIQQIFKTLNEPNVGQLDHESLLKETNRAIALYETSDDQNFRVAQMKNIALIEDLKQIIETSMRRDSDIQILSDTHDLSDFAFECVEKLGKIYAEYCLSLLSWSLC